MKAARPGQFMFIRRQQAARLLRAARNVHAENLGERIGWALAAMKDSRHAHRLKIDYLLSSGNFDSADAMLARHLLTGREHPLMRLRFARSMFLQGRHDSAKHEITRVIAERPDHIGANQLAAAIASAAGKHDQAVQFLVTALDLRPSSDQVRIQLIEALLDAGLITHAERELARLADPPVVLHARVLRAAGRTVEALDLLRHVSDVTAASSPRLTALLELIAASEAIGDLHQLTRMAEWSPRDSRLTQSDHDEFHDHVTHACVRSGGSPTNRAELEAMITGSHRDGSPTDDAAVARLWLGRLQGQVLSEQADAAASGADPSPNLLPPLLEAAAATLSRHLDAEDAGFGRQASTLRQHRDLIHRALGQSLLGCS